MTHSSPAAALSVTAESSAPKESAAVTSIDTSASGVMEGESCTSARDSSSTTLGLSEGLASDSVV